MQKTPLILYIIFFVLFYGGVKAQSTVEQKIDSLQNSATQTQDLKTKASLFNQLWELEFTRWELENGLNYAKKANEIAQKIEDDNNLGLSYTGMAQYYSYINSYLMSIEYYEKALVHFKAMDNIWRIAFTSYYLGKQYNILSIQDKALKNYYTSLDYYKKNNQPEGIIMAYSAIGAIYSVTNEYDKAPGYFKKAIELCEQTNDVHQKIHLLENIGIHYYRHNQWDFALQYFFEEIDLIDQNPEYGHDLASASIYIGEIKTKQKKYEEALYYLTNSEKIYSEIGLIKGKIGAIRRLALLYYGQKKYSLAQEHIQQSIDFHLQTKEKNPLFDDYRILSLIQEETRNYKGALDNYKLFKSYQDSLKLDDASITAMKYEFDKKETQLKTLQEAELVRNKTIANRTYSILGAIILLVVLLLYIYWIRNKKLLLEKQNLELKRREAELAKESEEFKVRFLSNISHEFRTPLTLINGHLEILKKVDPSAHYKRYVEMEYSGKRLLQLINQLLDLTKLETGKYRLYYRKGNLLNEVQSHIQAFHSLAEQKDVELSTTISFAARVKFAHRDFTYSSEALASILNNLLSNAFKFTPATGSIHVTVDYLGGKLYLAVRDTGPGIPEEDVLHIFERFYQTKQADKQFTEGSGIGLTIVKELSNYHGGDAQVIQNPEGGCTFSVWLAEGEVVSEQPPHTSTEIPIVDHPGQSQETEAFDPENKTLILIVEDQKELRKFMVENLGSSYCFLEAENGQQGIEMAIKHLPEIIISDVMMPGTDGFHLTKTLKLNEITSHIPIILLTAKAEQDDILEGFEYGADDYLTKPFSIAELQLRIKNRLRQQENLRLKFAEHSLQLKSEHVPELNLIDRQFVDKLNHIVLQNIDNEIDVSLLASEIGLSNSQLTRKLKIMLGITPANFIKNIRMEFALDLLSQGYSVSETSWKSGYDEPAYFSKVFKKHFGFLPSEKEKF